MKTQVCFFRNSLQCLNLEVQPNRRAKYIAPFNKQKSGFSLPARVLLLYFHSGLASTLMNTLGT